MKIQLDEKIFECMQRAFMCLIANPDSTIYENKSLWQFYCTEASMTQGLERLFGVRCDPMARILYYKMARGRDHARVDFVRFARVFEGLLDEVQKKRNRVIFNLLDVKGKGKLDIVFIF